MTMQEIATFDPPPEPSQAKAPDDLRREALQRAVIEALARGASYQKAADAAGVTRRTIYNWRDGDEGFAKLAADAIEAGADLLEDEAHRRAMGWEEDVFNKDGERVGTQFKASDRLMEFMLAGRRPEKFREKKSIIVNAQSETNTNVNVLVSAEPMSAEDWERAYGHDAKPVAAEQAPALTATTPTANEQPADD